MLIIVGVAVWPHPKHVTESVDTSPSSLNVGVAHPDSLSDGKPESKSTSKTSAPSQSTTQTAPTNSTNTNSTPIPDITNHLGEYWASQSQSTPQIKYNPPSAPAYSCVTVNIPDSSYTKDLCGYEKTWAGHICDPIFWQGNIVRWSCS